MSISIGANGNSYAYPQTDDTLWGDDATNWASAVSAALSAIGLGATVNSKAVIDMISTTKGFLPPRQTTTQRDAISTPPTALVIYNTTTNEVNIFTGSTWFGIPVRDALTSGRIVQWDGAKLVDSPLTASGSDLTITGNFTAQIGTFNTRVVSAVMRAASSAGIALQNSSGTEVAVLGAGPGTGVTFQGGVNIVGTTTATNGLAITTTTTTDPGIRKSDDTNTGIHWSAANQLDIVTDGQTRFRVLPTGQLQAVYESQVGTDYNTTLHNGYFFRAWVNFNGTGTPAIRASGNVSSITDNGTGDYTINYTVAMPDDSYAPFIATGGRSDSAAVKDDIAGSISASSVRIETRDGSLIDRNYIFVGIIR
jgi:hypothetical protein